MTLTRASRDSSRRWHKWAISFGVVVVLSGTACLPTRSPQGPPPAEPENQRPVVLSVTAEEETAASGQWQMTCEATDADDDVLTYSWSAPDGGRVEGEGDIVAWVAPEVAGDYTVRVMVKDGKGGEAMGSVTITVVPVEPNQPPVITSFVAEQERIRIFKTTTVECIAEDPDGDELAFIWRATGGKVHGEGPAVQYIAPGVKGDYTVTVTVSDGRGGEAEASTELEVFCCGH